MNLIFDIDDTITNETEFMLKYAPKYLKKKFNVQFDVQNPNGYDVSEVFGIEEYLKNNDYSQEQIKYEMERINSCFWNKYFVRYMFYPIKKDVSKVIKELSKKGYKINFVSLRGKKTHDNENFIQKIVREEVVPLLTKLQLKINNIKYDNLFLVQTNDEKISKAKELNAKLVFDDNTYVLENLDSSIIPVCIETPHNELTNFENSNICRIPFEYKSIDEVIGNLNMTPEKVVSKTKSKTKIKSLKVYQKVYTESFYRLVRFIGKGKVIEHYNPIVIGEDNLPKEKGANVFVGNHRDIKDPLITIALLEKPTHFAALKRMFEYNENIFGPVGKNVGTVATTLFVKSLGALPIARSTDDEYRITNLQTFKYISDYLKKGSDVAIYPEGTLNREPDKNGNILPLKSNQSFKIAEKGKAVIRPVAIVWIPKELKTKNRVIISFLKPIYTEGLRANEIAEKWNYSVNTAIDSMNKIIEEMIKINDNEELKLKEIDTLKDKIKKL